MPLLALVIAPLAGSFVAAGIPSNEARPWVVPVAGLVHAVLVVVALASGTTTQGWFGLDPLNRVVLAQVSLLFLVASLYAPGYLKLRSHRDNRLFTAMSLMFLAMATVAVLARHIGLMWAGIEACTLSTATLVHFNPNPRSVEATWKYLLVGSVGISMALLGSLFLAYSSVYAHVDSTLFFDDLLASAPRLSHPWLHAALVLLFIGYGTKMGLAPMHAWKPDAYGEAPGFVGVLLSGGLTSVAFLAVLRFVQIGNAAGDQAYTDQLLVAAGLLSMAVAGLFLVRQGDYKRMLAYSSVEHMGILVLGVGLGGAGVFGALYHMLGNAFTKGALFLAAGNIHRAYGSKRTDDVRGALQRTPWSAAFFLVGFLAIVGAPPFGPFMSEYTILGAALGGGHLWIALVFLALLFLVFLGMGAVVLTVVQGQPSAQAAKTKFADGLPTAAPIALFLGLSLVLGVWLPSPVMGALTDAAAFISSPPTAPTASVGPSSAPADVAPEVP